MCTWATWHDLHHYRSMRTPDSGVWTERHMVQGWAGDSRTCAGLRSAAFWSSCCRRSHQRTERSSLKAGETGWEDRCQLTQPLFLEAFMDPHRRMWSFPPWTPRERPGGKPMRSCSLCLWCKGHWSVGLEVRKKSQLQSKGERGHPGIC